MVMLFLYLAPIAVAAFLLGALPLASFAGRLFPGIGGGQASARAGAAAAAFFGAARGAAAVLLCPLLSRALGFPDTGDFGRVAAALAASAGASRPPFGLPREGPAPAVVLGACAALWLPALPVCAVLYAAAAVPLRSPALGGAAAALGLALAYFIAYPSRMPWNPAGIEPKGVAFLVFLAVAAVAAKADIVGLVRGAASGSPARKVARGGGEPGAGPGSRDVPEPESGEDRERRKIDAFLSGGKKKG